MYDILTIRKCFRIRDFNASDIFKWHITINIKHIKYNMALDNAILSRVVALFDGHGR